ncbi:cyclic nucleotide-binding domain-containing protein [candidate division CSSED10-310 bacterium]|uniref:Cyclic nucleotide-binding domain-containing protein n=1 Tax=candidate division CSSED10-310 bacterium TaxID=2855610 RepID=A0ABV6YUU5_UNCC1
MKADELLLNSNDGSRKKGDLSISTEEYCKLADKFASQKMYDEALEIYERAITTYPNDLFLKISYSKLLEDKSKFERDFWRKNEDKIQKLRKYDDTLCNHYIGLGDLYVKQQKISKAIEAFEFAKYRNPFSFIPYLRLSEIYYSQNSYDIALEELIQARAFNKFEEKIYLLLGKIYLKQKNFSEALKNFVDASILSGKHFKETPYQREIKIAFEKANLGEEQTINHYVHARNAVFTKLMDIINRQKGKDIENIGANHIREIIDRFREKQIEEELIKTVERLRKCILVQELSESELYRVGMICHPMEMAAGERIFQEHEPGGRLLLIDTGAIKISRTLGVGERSLAEFQAGSYFGEMDFLDNLSRSSDAYTLKKSRLFYIERDDLIDLFEKHKKIAVKMLIVFWKTLALRIRDSNEMLKSFFEAKDGESEIKREEIIHRDRSIEVDLKKKIDILREKGLSEKDLKVLASLTKEELYHQDELLFSEGDEGNTLYFILEGKVRVTKNIPGVGEEALAILDQGDFFGEMSLIDNSKRSADVRSHQGPVTVLTISKQMLGHILYSDISMAYQFLGILCRLLSRRLRTINDMICKWHVMSGGF